MTVHNAVSTSITNDDANPRVRASTGQGGPAEYSNVEDYVTVPAAAAATSTFRILRIPSNVIVKHLYLDSGAQAAGKVDVGVYYPDTASEVAGGSGLETGAVISQAFFASDVDLASAVQKTDIINESGTNTPAKRQQPLWQAIGLSTDPGGKLDIVATVHTTDVTTGLALLALEAQFVVPR